MRTRARTSALTVVLALLLVLSLAGSAGSVLTPKRVLGKGLRIACENKANEGPELYVKPRTCVVFDAEMTSAGSVDLHRLRWSRWSTSGATGTGVECAFRARCDNTKVRVTLSGLKRVECGRNDYRVFTRLKSTSGFGTTRLTPLVCPSDEG